MGVRTEVVMLGRKFRGRGKSRRHVMDFTSFLISLIQNDYCDSGQDYKQVLSIA